MASGGLLADGRALSGGERRGERSLRARDAVPGSCARASMASGGLLADGQGLGGGARRGELSLATLRARDAVPGRCARASLASGGLLADGRAWVGYRLRPFAHSARIVSRLGVRDAAVARQIVCAGDLEHQERASLGAGACQ